MLTALIIPVHNPDNTFIPFVQAILDRKRELMVMVVDDGSDTRFAGVFHSLKYTRGVSVCRHPQKYGRGAAVKTGIRYIRKNYPGCVAYIVADMKKNRNEFNIFQVLSTLEQNPDCLIICESPESKNLFRNIVDPLLWGPTRGFFKTGCKRVYTGLWAVPDKLADLCLDTPKEQESFDLAFLAAAAERKVAVASALLLGQRKGCSPANPWYIIDRYRHIV